MLDRWLRRMLRRHQASQQFTGCQREVFAARWMNVNADCHPEGTLDALTAGHAKSRGCLTPDMQKTEDGSRAAVGVL